MIVDPINRRNPVLVLVYNDVDPETRSKMVDDDEEYNQTANSQNSSSQ